MEEKNVNCTFCKGKVILMYEDIPLLEGKIILKGEPFYKCTKCKKEYVSSEQMKLTEKHLNAFYVRRPVITTGRSLALTIPPDIASFYSIKKGTEIQIIPEDRKTIRLKLQ